MQFQEILSVVFPVYYLVSLTHIACGIHVGQERREMSDIAHTCYVALFYTNLKGHERSYNPPTRQCLSGKVHYSLDSGLRVSGVQLKLDVLLTVIHCSC